MSEEYKGYVNVEIPPLEDPRIPTSVRNASIGSAVNEFFNVFGNYMVSGAMNPEMEMKALQEMEDYLNPGPVIEDMDTGERLERQNKRKANTSYAGYIAGGAALAIGHSLLKRPKVKPEPIDLVPKLEFAPLKRVLKPRWHSMKYPYRYGRVHNYKSYRRFNVVRF